MLRKIGSEIYIIFFFVIFMIASIVYLFSTERRAEQALRDTSTISQNFADLGHSLGYNGFIHNFKNAVLRPDEFIYLERATHNYVEVESLLTDLEQRIARANITADLSPLFETLQTYSTKLQQLIELDRTVLTIGEVDAIVRVDDKTAAEALQNLESAVKAELSNRIVTLNGYITISWLATLALVVIVISLSTWSYRNRLHYERNLKNAAQVYLQAGLNAFIVRDKNSQLQYVSEEFTTLTGYKLASFPDLSVIFPDICDPVYELGRQEWANVENEKVITHSDLVLVCADGRRLHVKRSIRKFKDNDGDYKLMIAFEDLTKVHIALKQANKYLEVGLNAFCIQNEKFDFIFISNSFRDLFKLREDQEFTPENHFVDDIENTIINRRENFNKLKLGDIFTDLNLKMKTSAGDIIYLNTKSRWFEDPLGEMLLIQEVVDVTKDLEQKQRIQDQANILENQTEELAISNEELLRRNALIEQQKKELRAKNIQLEDQSAELEVQVEELTTTEDELQHRAIELQKLNDQLAHQARTDPLTGLVNRLGLSEQLLRDTNSLRDSNLAIYLLDLDYFKSVNDTYSHQVGDMLLKEIAKSLQLVVWPEDIVCRYGGEEFVVVTKYISKKETIKFGEALRSALNSAAVLYDGHRVSRTASIGCVKLGKSMSQSEALHLADLAMMEGKQLGRDKVIFADSAFLKEMQERGAFITDEQVGDALHRGEICYYAQPIYDTHTDTIRGFEALARWVKPEGDVILPKKFISKFVNIAFTEKYWAARQKMSVELLSALRGFPECYVSINLKLEHFENPTFIDRMIETGGELHSETKTDHRFIFEISESAMTQRVDLDVIRNNLQRIRDKGYMIALDDFGIEHSNLSRLLDLPIDIIKLDRKMIQNAAANEAAEIILKSIVRMAHSLGIMTVAEGVETQAQAQMVSDAGVFLQQGFLHAHPMPLDQLKAISPNIDVESNTLH